MVVTLGPGKFYGSSLPRPRYYTDVKFNDVRVDPPVPVLDPLLSWANEAHWSMGGLSFKRLRLQGRIEGNVRKLQAEREKVEKKKIKEEKLKIVKKKKKIDTTGSDLDDENEDDDVRRSGKSKSVSPPPAPIASKRRRLLALLDEDAESGEYKEEIGVVKRRLVKKLGDDFDRVAAESKRNQLKGLREKRSEGNGVGESIMKIVGEINEENSNSKGKQERKGKSGGELGFGSVSGKRTSPRLVKIRSN